MLTALNDDETILESIQAGADGYLTKDKAVEEVVSAVRSAHAGETLWRSIFQLKLAQNLWIRAQASSRHWLMICSVAPSNTGVIAWKPSAAPAQPRCVSRI